MVSIAAALLLFAASAIASPPAPVGDAIAMLHVGQAKLIASWRYQETITDAGGSVRLGHDPDRSEGSRWRVLAVNGKKPDAADEKRFAEQAAQAVRAGAGTLSATSDWLATSKYDLVDTTTTTLVYQLRPRPGKQDSSAEANLLRHLAGRLVIGRDDHRPLTLSLDNFESFSPRFGVSIGSFAFRADFRRLDADGPVVVARTSTETRGKLFWLKHFDNRTEIVMSDFAPAAATAPTPASTARAEIPAGV
ncbi:MAG: hypothetical protein ACRES7_06345 [Gammaproteobacteria bacterium]